MLHLDASKTSINFLTGSALNEVNDNRAKKTNNSFRRTLYRENGQSITIFWQAIICPESCLLAVTFFNQRILRQSPILPLLWVWFDPCRQCVNLRDDISFPQFFPDLYFQSLGKKYWTLKEFYSRSVWLRGSFYIVLLVVY